MAMLSTDTVLSPIVGDFESGAVNEDTDAAADAGCQRKAAESAPILLIPPIP